MNTSVQRAGRAVRLASDETLGDITCVVCNAAYTPAKGFEYLLQTPSVALESAFMSMCHFCFRCRRPACPSCWDDANGVCGVCSQEAHLPFRSEAPPLNGMLFPPVHHVPPTRERAMPTPLVCVRPGRFQTALPPPMVIDQFPEPEPLLILETPFDAPPEEPVPLSSPFDRHAPEPRVVTALPLDRPTGPLPVTASPRPVVDDVDTLPTRPPRSGGGRIRLALTLLLLVLVLLVVLGVVLAEMSVTVNSFILSLLRIDIRAEIAYLWHLIQQLVK